MQSVINSVLAFVVVFQLGLIIDYLKKTVRKIDDTEAKVNNHEVRITVLENKED